MTPPYGPVTLVACVLASSPQPGPSPYGPERQHPAHCSYLHLLQPCADGHCQPVVEPYCPQEGDLVFAEDHNPIFRTLFLFCGSGKPTHCAIVIRRPGGDLALLEAGPNWKPSTYINDIESRLCTFKGDIWVRRCRHALTPEQSCALTEYAMAQEGKPYAVCRFVLQGTPFRARYGLRYHCFATTHLHRWGWLCSELVVAAGTVAGLFDPGLHPSNAIYPRDLVDDRDYPLRHNWEDIGLWRPDPHPVDPHLIRPR